MTREEAASLVGGFALVAGSIVGSLAFGEVALHVVLVLAILWLLYDRVRPPKHDDATPAATPLAEAPGDPVVTFETFDMDEFRSRLDAITEGYLSSGKPRGAHRAREEDEVDQAAEGVRSPETEGLQQDEGSEDQQRSGEAAKEEVAR